MKNCLIMGFGRSGTSLMGGILHQAGYFLGENLYPPRISNPKGFFENALINGINEKLLKVYDHCRSHEIPLQMDINHQSPYNPGEGQRWLSFIPPDVCIENDDPLIENEILDVLKWKGFSYKDPRFNYTLPIWMKYLQEDVIFICLFREPAVTVESVIKECRTADYLSGFSISPDLAFSLWCNSYAHLLRNMQEAESDRFVFVHYKQILSGHALGKLSDKLGVPLDPSFILAELNRSVGRTGSPFEAEQLYKDLCLLAEYSDNL